MTHIRYIITTLLFCLSLQTIAHDMHFRNINVGNGLSNNEINAIFKDSEGYFWIATASGLNRYDGNEIRVFRHNPADTTSIVNNYVEEVFEDSSKRIWLRTSGVYSYYSPKEETFTKLSEESLKKWNISGTPNLIRPSGNDLWIATGGTGLYKINLTSGSEKARKMLDIPTESSNFTSFMPLADQGLAIAVTDQGYFFVLDYDDGHIIHSSRIPDSGKRITGYQLMLEPTGNMWVYSNEGTYIYDLNTKEWRAAPVSSEKLPVTALARDSQGNIWIGYDKDGIEILSPDGVRTSVTNNPMDMFSLSNDCVRSIYTDDAGGIWIGTYKRGLSVYYPNDFKLDMRYISDINCVCPVAGEPDWVWLGSNNNGLMKYNIATEQLVRIPNYKNKAIVCFAYDHAGVLWFGTYEGGLYSYKDGKIQNFTTKDGIASDNIWAILPNNNGTLWLGTLGGGVQLYNPASKSGKTFNSSNSALKNNFINTLTRTADGSILIGSADVPYVMSPATHQISADRLGNLGRNHRKLSAINQLLVDSRGLLWIAGRDGLECYDSRRDSLYTVAISAQTVDNIILGIVEASDRTVWASTNGALFNITVSGSPDNKLSFKTITYDSRDGVSEESFNQRSFCLLPSGKIVAGTHSGIAIIEPAKLSGNMVASRILLTGLTVNNHSVLAGDTVDGDIVLPVAINHLQKLELKPTQNSFTISFSSDNYAGISRIRYRYRLNGFDEEWTICPAGQNRAAFNNIPPGNYTFEVEAIDDDGVPNGTVRSLPIHVATPWWSTWWAYLIYAILIIGGCTLVVLWVKRRERARFAMRKQEDAMRKEEELNQLKFKFFTNISHELRTPLTLILSPAESMLKEMTEERDVRRLTTIRDNANRLLYLVNQLLDFRKNEMSELHLHLSKGDLVATVRNACQSFMDMTERRRQHFEFVADQPEMEMEFDNDKVTKTILNLLSNAVKYTPEEGNIEVRVGTDGENAVIEVKDTGTGISDADKQHIFERFYRSQDKSDLNTGSGIGLSMVYEYVRLHNGKVSVDDNTPKGTVFRVTIPATLAAEGTPKTLEKKNTEESEAKVETKRPQVLFVDDNHDLIEFLRDEFSHEYDVCTAKNGIEAIKLSKEHKFDLIVSDIMMPEMDGIQLCRRLKSNAATVNVPVILLTAKQDVGSVIEGLTLGADDYVTKPFNNEVLRLRMSHLIALRRSGLRHSLIEPSPKEIDITSVDEQLVAKAVEFVEANMDRTDLTVEEMAGAMGMSRVHLYKRLSALTGRTPVEFIRIMRLKRATQYLRDKHLTIAEIAYRVGFNNPKYFSKHFKEEFGMSPGEYQSKENTGSAD